LRTPLTVILLESEPGVRGAGDARVGFETIRDRARRLGRRIDDMLRVARSESGRIELSHEPCDLGRVATEAVADIRPDIAAAGMSMNLASMAGLRVLGNPDGLRQLIAGLVQNAVRHAGPGGQLAVAIAADGGWGVLRVTDNGPGLPADEIGRVFTRFHRGEVALVSPVPEAQRLGTEPGMLVALRLPLIEA